MKRKKLTDTQLKAIRQADYKLYKAFIDLFVDGWMDQAPKTDAVPSGQSGGIEPVAPVLGEPDDPTGPTD